jgi:hypothetical protein
MGSSPWGTERGFVYPPRVLEEVLQGRTVGEVMSELTGIEKIGHKGGAIGYLSKNLLTREQLTEQAVLMALIPRIRPGALCALSFWLFLLFVALGSLPPLSPARSGSPPAPPPPPTPAPASTQDLSALHGQRLFCLYHRH